MSRFNLLDEPWITVIMSDSGAQKNVSLSEVFRDAQKIRCLAGDTKTQDFAVLRLLLAVVQTVFSRVDASGEAYTYLELDERMRPEEPAEEDGQEETWNNLWDAGKFPGAVIEYLECWRDHFYLLDDKFPFFQVNHIDISKRLPEKKKPTAVFGKTFNRVISESNNKTALFSPRADAGNIKDCMTEAELARWLITFQGYSGLSDKASLVEKSMKPSKGWLFDLGGIYLSGENLFETLVMNYIPPNEEDEFPIQNPCWEHSGNEVLAGLLSGRTVNNLAELYTNWSRAISINPEMDFAKPISINIVKVPALEHADNFLEPMTIWKKNLSGEYKDRFIPQKHRVGQSMWRSFGSIAMRTSKDQHLPEIMKQFVRVKKTAGNRNITVNAVSMADDGNATSWMPVDEIADSLRVNDLVITDQQDDGWVVRIKDVVEETKFSVDTIFRRFLKQIEEIRNLNKSGFVERNISRTYFLIDQPFRDWIETIAPNDVKEKKIHEWKLKLERLVLDQAKTIVQEAGNRDFTGKDGNNIITAFLSFQRNLKKKLE